MFMFKVNIFYIFLFGNTCTLFAFIKFDILHTCFCLELQVGRTELCCSKWNQQHGIPGEQQQKQNL